MKISKLNKHAGLVNRMSDALGIDMADAALHHRIPVNELRSQVLRCLHCKEVESCETFLDSHTHGADAAPEYCQNRMLFESLKPA